MTERATAIAEGAAKAYQQAKEAAPSSLAPSLEALEAALAVYGGPVVAKVQETAPKLFKEAEAATKRLGELVTIPAVGESMASFKAMREQYLQAIENFVAEVKAGGVSSVTSKAVEGLTAAVAEARAKVSAVDFSPYVEKVMSAWTTLVAQPPVAKAMEASKSAVAAAQARYVAAHDVLVADPRYAAAVGKGGEFVSKVTSSEYYKKAEALAMPYIEKAMSLSVVQSAVSASEPYAAAMIEHLKPVAA